MRLWETVFLVLLFLYHAGLLVSRRHRPYILNFLAFPAALAALAFLWWEGLRWQDLGGLVLLLVDLVILFATFRSLRGRDAQTGFLTAVGGFFRGLFATLGFLTVGLTLVLTALFPLPKVPVSGGYPVAVRHLVFQDTQTPGGEAFSLVVWYPASGSSVTVPRWIQTPEAWREVEKRSGLPVLFSSYLEHLPPALIEGGRLPKRSGTFPVVVFSAPQGRNPEEWSFLMEDFASRGFVVAAASYPPQDSVKAAPWWESLRSGWNRIRLQNWKEPVPSGRAFGSALVVHALDQLNREPNDFFFQSLDLNRKALISLGTFTQETDESFKTSVWLGQQAPDSPLVRTANRRLFIPYDGSRELQADHLPQGSRLYEVSIRGLQTADLSDSSLLRPYLYFFGQKTRLDSRLQMLSRGYLEAWLQFALLDGDPSLFEAPKALDDVSIRRAE